MTKIDKGEKERGEEFVKRYGELVKEFEFDFASYPVYIPDGQGGFKTIVQTTPISTKNQPKKSPFMAKE